MAIPALPDTERKTTYVIVTPTTGPLAVGFQLYGNGTDYQNWIQVWDDGVELTHGVDFTFSLVSGAALSTSTPRPITDGQITFTSNRSGTIHIIGRRRPRRTSQFTEGVGIPSTDHNRVLTDMVATEREFYDLQSRMLLLPPGDNSGLLPTEAERTVGGALGWLPGAPGTFVIFPFSGSVTVGGTDVESIAALRLVSGSDARNAIYVRGYYAGSTKGAGWFARQGSQADDGFLYIQDAGGRTWARVLPDDGPDSYMAGAKGDATIDVGTGEISGTDDTTAINALIDYLRDNVVGAPLRARTVAVKIGHGVFRCDGSINCVVPASALGNGLINGYGATIASKATGKPAFDMSSAIGVVMTGTLIYGDPTARPAVGLWVNRSSFFSQHLKFEGLCIEGEFEWIGGYVSGAELVTFHDCVIRNNYIHRKCYGFGMDSVAFLRYDPPILSCTFDESSPMEVTTPSPHGLVDGVDKVWVKDNAGAGRKWTVTVTGVDTFTIPVDGADYPASGSIFRSRFGSDYVDDADDTLEPYVGSGAFSLIFEGGRISCPYGFAAILDTFGGNRKWNTFALCSIYDHQSHSDKAITSITGATATVAVTGHGMSVGQVVWIEGTSQAANNDSLYSVATVPTADSITLEHIDGSAITMVDSTGGTIRVQNTSGGYGIHFVGTEFENPRFDTLHVEYSSAQPFTHAIRGHAYIQNLDVLREGGSAQPVLFQNAFFMDHAWHDAYAGFTIDSSTVSTCLYTGTISAVRINNTFGQGIPSGKLFVNPVNWIFSGDIWASDPTILSASAAFDGRLINALTGEISFGLVADRDDFLGDVLRDQWNGRVGTDAQCVAPRIVVASGGLCRLTTGDDAAADMATNGVQLEGALNWQASRGGLTCEFRVSINDVTTVAMFVGLTDQTSALEMPFTLSGTTLTSNATDAVGVLYDTAATNDRWHLVGVANNVDATMQNTNLAPVNNGSETWRIQLKTSGEATFYREGVKIGTAMTGAVTTSVALAPVVAAFSRAAASRNVDVRKYLCQMNR